MREERLQVRLREVADADVAHKPPAMHKRQRLGSAYGARPRDRVISQCVMQKLQRAMSQALNTQYQILKAKR